MRCREVQDKAYVVTVASLEATSFDVAASCAAGYEGVPVVKASGDEDDEDHETSTFGADKHRVKHALEEGIEALPGVPSCSTALFAKRL